MRPSPSAIMGTVIQIVANFLPSARGNADPNIQATPIPTKRLTFTGPHAPKTSQNISRTIIKQTIMIQNVLCKKVHFQSLLRSCATGVLLGSEDGEGTGMTN